MAEAKERWVLFHASGEPLDVATLRLIYQPVLSKDQLLRMACRIGLRILVLRRGDAFVSQLARHLVASRLLKPVTILLVSIVTLRVVHALFGVNDLPFTLLLAP